MENINSSLEKFLPFLEDLRSRLYRGVILFVVTFLVGFLSAGLILKWILGIVHIDQVIIATSSPFQFTDVAMDVGFFCAIMVCVPYIIQSCYAFIGPALTRREKIGLLKSIPASAGLFIVGFCYGFFILYYALGLLAAINTGLGIANFWNISQFLSEILITSALLGLVFEFPLLLLILAKLRIIKQQVLKDNRRIAYFLTVCLTALLPPTDGVSLLAMAMPLVLLYEGTILLIRR
ncbi:MAG: twin-arginine translocase subunit TatC [Patescibacteria group bacterium]